MSNAYIDINVKDYTGNNALSTYALSATPLLFYPEYTFLENSDNNVLWDFGDDTISGSVSASKYYKFPGEYIVTMVLYNCEKNAIVSTINKTITVYDYVPLTMNIEYSSLSAKCGQASNIFQLNTYYPVYQPAINVFYSVSGSNSSNYWNVEHLKYSHLENTYNVWELFYNNHIQSYQYRDIHYITPTIKKLYAKVDNGSIVSCKHTDNGSFYVGLSGNSGFFFKDDLPNTKVLMYLYFDKTGYVIPDDNLIKFTNNLGITIPLTVLENIPDRLSITSNGMDGEYYSISSFNINKIKYYDTLIPFVVKTKDFDGFTLKNVDQIQLSSISFSVLSSGVPLSASYYDITSLNYTLSSQNNNGSFRACVKFNNQSTPLRNITLSSNAILTLSGDMFSGVSNIFDVYPRNYYDAYKKNENFDANQTLKDLIFQEILINDDVLFDDFLGGSLGNSESDHQGIYLKIYEKISNFVANTRDVDVSEIDFLNSLSNEVNLIDINDEGYSYPEKIKRLIDLLSINQSKLFGSRNMFDENFDTKGYTVKSQYGTNLGDKLTYTHWITAGNDIVALEKFSNTYVRLNTLQPLSSINSNIYNLSSYNSDWGWPLVLPTTFNTSDFEKYYIFFEYVPTKDNNILGGVLDFDNVKTNISLSALNSELTSDGGIYDNMLLYALYDSLNLIED